MKKSKLSLGGLLLIGLGVYGLLSGKTLSISKTEFIATRTDDFAGYWIVITLLFYFGFRALKDSFNDKKEIIISSENFKNSNDFLQFKKFEKNISNTAMFGAVVGFLSSFIVGFVTLSALNIDGDSCIKCQENGDWWGLIFFGSMILLPVFCYKVFLKIKATSLVNKGVVSKSELNMMKFFKGKYNIGDK